MYSVRGSRVSECGVHGTIVEVSKDAVVVVVVVMEVILMT